MYVCTQIMTRKNYYYSIKILHKTTFPSHTGVPLCWFQILCTVYIDISHSYI